MNINQLNALSADLMAGKPGMFHVHYWGEIADHRSHSLHKHSFFECCYVTGGQGFYYESGERYALDRGDLFLTRPHAWHRIESEDGIGLVWVAFMIHEHSSADGIDRYRRLTDAGRILVRADTPSLTGSLWQTLLTADSAAAVNRPLMGAMASGLLLSLLPTFLDGQAPERMPSEPAESVLLHKARLFIHDNLSLRFKLRDLARYLHISERHLSRLFKDRLGVSFSDYYREAKLRTATALLESTDSSLEQVSAAAGFCSVHHFAKAFKQATGIPPGQWRKIK